MTRDAEMSPARLRRARRPTASAPRPTSSPCRPRCGRRQSAIDLYVRPGPPRRQPRPARRRPCASSLHATPSRAATTSSPSSARSPGVATDRRGPRLPRGPARRQPRSSRAWSSTPSCAGPCCAAWSAPARAATPPSTPSWRATPPPSGSGTRPPRGRPARRRRPRRRPGPGSSSTTSCPTPCRRRPSAASWTPTSASCCAPYVDRYFASIGQVWETRTIRDGHEHRDRPLPGAVRRAGDGRPHERLPRDRGPGAGAGAAPGRGPRRRRARPARAPPRTLTSRDSPPVTCGVLLRSLATRRSGRRISQDHAGCPRGWAERLGAATQGWSRWRVRGAARARPGAQPVDDAADEVAGAQR